MSHSNSPGMTIGARLTTTAIAGAAGYGAVGLTSLFVAPVATWFEVIALMALFVAVYVPGVFAARRMLRPSTSPVPVRATADIHV